MGSRGSCSVCAPLPRGLLIMKMKPRKAQRLWGRHVLQLFPQEPVPVGSQPGWRHVSPHPCCPGPSWPWVLALRPAGLLTGQGCLSGRAAGAGDREDGVGHDTINLII